MKILYHHRIRSKDGQFVHIEELTRALAAQGHELVFVAPSAVSQAQFGADSGFVGVLRRFLPRALYEVLEFGYAFGDYLRLSRAIREHRPQAIYERYNLFLPSGVWAARRFKLPLILEVNAPLLEERGRFGGIALRRLAAWTERFAWRGADFALPVTSVLARKLVDAGVDPGRVVVIPNGIDPEKFESAPDREEAKRRLGLTGRLVLGFTGFAREWHRLDRVLEFMARSSDPRLHFLLVGDGPARAPLEAQARALNLQDRVTILGVVGRADVAARAAAFDVALQPAVVEYASPLKLFEYLVLGHVIVAPAMENIREILADDVNGLLFEPESDASFAEALGRACGDAQLRVRLSQAARRTIEEQGLTWARNAERVTALLERALLAKQEAGCAT